MSMIVDHLNTSEAVSSYKLPDQELLIDVFKGQYQPLPWWTNAFQTARAVHPDLWSNTEVRLLPLLVSKSDEHLF